MLSEITNEKYQQIKERLKTRNDEAQLQGQTAKFFKIDLEKAELQAETINMEEDITEDPPTLSIPQSWQPSSRECFVSTEVFVWGSNS